MPYQLPFSRCRSATASSRSSGHHSEPSVRATRPTPLQVKESPLIDATRNARAPSSVRARAARHHRRIERDVGFAFVLTAMLRYSTESRLRGEQTASGSAFTYELERRINEYPERITGKATSSSVGGTAEIKLPARTVDFAMPGGT